MENPSSERPLLHLEEWTTPIGNMICGTTESSLVLLEFATPERLALQLPKLEDKFLISEEKSKYARTVKRQLDEYFSGARTTFDVNITFTGTEFQNLCWEELQRIPYGKTWTYTEQALNMHQVAAIRAIAAANGQNKIAVVVPCHRVVGANNELTGYSGGINNKKFLLTLEQGMRQTTLF